MLKRIVSTFFLAIIFVVLSSNFVYAVRNIETTDISNNCKGVSVQENMTTDFITEMLQLTVDVVETQQLILNTNINSNVIEQETIEEKTEYMDPVNHDIAITFTSEYISKPDVMPYALYTPSSVKNNAESSLIVWLHGLGEVNVDSNTFLSAGLPTIIDNWKMEGFNSYILCPHLKGNWNFGNWCKPSAKDSLQSLIDKFILEHNVDTDNIFIIGHSLGGQGAMYMAHELQSYFSKCVVLSGYSSETDNSEITIPTIGYVGQVHLGEDACSIYYMENSFSSEFGRQNLFSIEASHGEVPKVAFSIDENNNNRSDLVEWILGEMEFSEY